MEKLPSSPPTKRMVIYKATEYGAIAGIIATWSISTAIAASEYELGLPISTFYSIIGIALGLTIPIKISPLTYVQPDNSSYSD